MTKAQKQNIIDKLEECVIMEASIECDNDGCNSARGGWYDGSDQAAEDFFKTGWRVNSKGFAICPKCVKKQNQ